MMFCMGAPRRSTARKHGSYQEIAASLRLRIREGDLQVGHYLPTERQLQEEFSASRSTVRRALSALVQSGWGENIPSKGVVAYRPGQSPKTKTIALIDATTYVLKVLFVRISDLLRDRGYHLVHLGSADSTIEGTLAYAVDHSFDGALIWPFRGYPDVDALARHCSQIPVVALNHKMRGHASDLVTFDYFEASRLATQRLIESGRRRIAITGMMDMLDVNHDRLSGYMKALFDGGLTPSASDFVFLFTSGEPEPDLRLLKSRLQDADRPDAVFVMQDEFTPRVVEAILEAGLTIPDDVAVSCIGDDVGIEVDSVGLTSVALDWEAMARASIDLLLARIEGKDSPPETIVAPHWLIDRGMSGSPSELWTPNPEARSGFGFEVPFPKTRFHYRSSLSADILAVSSTKLSHRRSM